MVLIIGGVVDAVTSPIDAIKDTVGDAFGAIASLLNEIPGVNIDPSVLQQVVTSIVTGGTSALASAAEEFGLESLAEEFGEATGLPVDDIVDTYNQVTG